MLDIITKNVGRIKEKVRKGVIPKKMKIVIVLDNDEQYIVQTRYFDQLRIKRPGRRIIVESESEAANRLITLAARTTPVASDVVILDSKGAGTNRVSYVFWFAPAGFTLNEASQLHGFVLSVAEQLSLKHEFVLRTEARIVNDLYQIAVDQRSGLHAKAA